MSKVIRVQKQFLEWMNFFRLPSQRDESFYLLFFNTTIILQRQRIKSTKMPWAGFEPLTLGVASRDEDQ